MVLIKWTPAFKPFDWKVHRRKAESEMLCFFPTTNNQQLTGRRKPPNGQIQGFSTIMLFTLENQGLKKF